VDDKPVMEKIVEKAFSLYPKHQKILGLFSVRDFSILITNLGVFKILPDPDFEFSVSLLCYF